MERTGLFVSFTSHTESQAVHVSVEMFWKTIAGKPLFVRNKKTNILTTMKLQSAQFKIGDDSIFPTNCLWFWLLICCKQSLGNSQNFPLLSFDLNLNSELHLVGEQK